MSLWSKAPQARLEPGRAVLGAEALERGEGWPGALAALEALLERAPAKRLRLVLSNHFVRYLVLPADAAVKGPAERAAWLAHHFAAVYGERAAAWAIGVERRGAASSLAAAVDAALLEQTRALAARRGVRLLSAEPLAIAAYNRARRGLRETTCFLAVLEPGRACLLLLEGERVLRVANRRAADPRAELDALVALEALDAGFARDARPPLAIAEPAAA